MIALSGDRTLLLRVFARRVSPCDDGIVISSVADLPSAEIVALFSDAPRRGDLPHTIVVAKSNLREFFAWASTYLGHWSPLTARVRVVRRIELSDLHFAHSDEHRLSLEVSRGLASLVIGEVLCEWSLAGEKSTPTFLSLHSTFGYTAFQALKRRRLDMAALLEAWERAQRILKQGARRIERKHFLSVWQPIVNCVTGIGDSPASPGQLASVLGEVVKLLRLPMIPLPESDLLFGPTEIEVPTKRREDAVVELEKWLAHRTSDRPIDKLFTACLATRLSPSALTHFDVLAKMTNTDPEALLWYSFLSGLLASEPSGQGIERMLFRLSGEFDGQLRDQGGDISLDELEVLAPTDGQISPWIGLGAGYVNVELKMGVCASFRLRDRTNGAMAPGHHRVDSGHDQQTFEELLEKLRIMYNRKPDLNQKKRRRKQ